jgi:hypothetical protein
MEENSRDNVRMIASDEILMLPIPQKRPRNGRARRDIAEKKVFN